MAWPPPDERPPYDAAVAVLEEGLEPDVLERSRCAGRMLSPDDAVAYALGG